ncbi:MAG: hypothetical protein NZ585_14675 [Chloracidobacterium sp.]|nr:hypothetical protein [Chloracidobacterium sp.]MDW8216656.1 hypothetical protein [Acidobacteriota bacterium]
MLSKLMALAALPRVYEKLLSILRSGLEPFVSLREHMLYILAPYAGVIPEIGGGLKSLLLEGRETAPSLRIFLLKTLTTALDTDEAAQVLQRFCDPTFERNATVQREAYRALSDLYALENGSENEFFVTRLTTQAEPDAMCQIFLISVIEGLSQSRPEAMQAFRHVLSHSALYEDDVVQHAFFSLLTLAAGTGPTADSALALVRETLLDEDLRSHLYQSRAIQYAELHIARLEPLREVLSEVSQSDASRLGDFFRSLIEVRT